ncbi:MAG: phosphatidate cytidylyltransferase [Vigna little leaf phytoplasma]|nr:phosphatidate cytidylyltransferase [Vigna little leaf phytoplasma]
MNHIFNRKIYIGFLMLIAILSFFFTLNQLEKLFPNLFLYVCCFIITLVVSKETDEMFTLSQIYFKIIPRKITWFIKIFCIMIFFYFVVFLIKSLNENLNLLTNKNLSNNFFNFLIKVYENKYFSFFLLFCWFLLLILFLFVNSFRTYHLQLTLLTILYIIFSNSCFLSLIILSYNWFIYIFFITICNDSFAFFGGNFFKGPLLCPQISPKKTWAGFFCGVFITSMIAIIYYLYSNKQYLNNNNYGLIFISFVLMSSIITQLGDLIISKFKRDSNIKDFNNLFPQHGGLLDRLDSLLLLSFFIVLVLLIPSSYAKAILSIIN